MQSFQDSLTLEMWAFEDNIVVTQDNGVWVFTTPDGTPLRTPPTLVPHTATIPTQPSPPSEIVH